MVGLFNAVAVARWTPDFSLEGTHRSGDCYCL